MTKVDNFMDDYCEGNTSFAFPSSWSRSTPGVHTSGHGDLIRGTDVLPGGSPKPESQPGRRSPSSTQPICAQQSNNIKTSPG